MGREMVYTIYSVEQSIITLKTSKADAHFNMFVFVMIPLCF